jgi:mutator protein MutT
VEEGVIAVIGKDGKFLTITRSVLETAPGKVCFPGGGIESGETPEAALIRECSEELGITVHSLRFFTENTTPWNVHLRWYFAAMNDGEAITPNPQEAAAVQWLTIEEILSHPDVLESNIPIVKQLQKNNSPQRKRGC